MAKNDKPLRERVAKELYAERVMNEMSQEDLAKSVGTKKSNISRIESGRQNISVNYLEILAEAMDKEVFFELHDTETRYGETNVYSLRLYDEELIRFRMTREGIEILSVNEDRKDVFPIGFDTGLEAWLKRRTIPKNRELVGTILRALGLKQDDLKGIIDISFGLSLNDSYWVVPEDFTGTFAEYNLYENDFNAALSLIAYTGYGSIGKKRLTTPELTTGGMLRKAWRNMDDDGIWLYKSGTDGFANAGNEPYCEYYASQAAKAMGLNAVSYELENWEHILASKSRLFTDIDTSYVPIGIIVNQGGIDSIIEYYRQLGDDFYQDLASMLVFDAVIINEDRHFGNFGLLRDNHTGEFISAAPIFDNGNSLLCRAMKSDFDGDLDSYISERTNPYGPGNDYFELAEKVIGPRQKKELRKLIGFRFRESDLTNLPSWRLTALEEMIQNRVRKLLAI